MNDPNEKLQGLHNTKYSNICTPAGCICTKIGPKDLIDEWSDNERETEDCDSYHEPDNSD